MDYRHGQLNLMIHRISTAARSTRPSQAGEQRALGFAEIPLLAVSFDDRDLACCNWKAVAGSGASAGSRAPEGHRPNLEDS